MPHQVLLLHAAPATAARPLAVTVRPVGRAGATAQGGHPAGLRADATKQALPRARMGGARTGAMRKHLHRVWVTPPSAPSVRRWKVRNRL
jgi:hypothetical protein